MCDIRKREREREGPAEERDTLHPWEIIFDPTYKIKGGENTLSNSSDYVDEIWASDFWPIARRDFGESTRSPFRHALTSIAT